MRELNSNFIFEFKAGDNICYNFEILKQLYEAKSKLPKNKKALFNKPIIIIIVSIIEAIFKDFYERIRSTNELIDILSSDTLKYFESKDLRTFESLIIAFKKHNILDVEPFFYDYLDFLRKVRNRVHIKLNKGDLAPDDRNVFNERILEKSEIICETVITKMDMSYCRNILLHHYVDSFYIPWEPRKIYPSNNCKKSSTLIS